MNTIKVSLYFEDCEWLLRNYENGCLIADAVHELVMAEKELQETLEELD